ncbi:MAG: ABC transporter permease [Patulibacter minatonensis]
MSRADANGTATRMPLSWARTWLIARRELRERVAQKAYRVVAIVGAVLVAAAVIVPTLIDGGDDAAERLVVPAAFVDLSAGDARTRADALEAAARDLGGERLEIEVVAERTVRDRVKAGDDDLGLVVRGPAERPRLGLLQRENSSTDVAPLAAVLQRAAITARLDQVAPEDRAQVLAPVDVQVREVPSTGPTPAAAGVVFAMTLVLYVIGLLLITSFANSIVSDRAGRIVERLLTAARPEEHLAGKLIGLGVAGFLQLGVWMVAGIAAALAVSGDLKDTFTGVPLEMLVWFPVAMVLTYVLYAALAAVLVIPVRKIEDVGGAVALGTMLQIGGYIATTTIVAPGSTVSSLVHALSFVPFFSPLLMLGRLAGGDVPAWELAIGFAGPLLLAVILLRLAAPAYARYAIDAPGGKGVGAALAALRARG